jgi:hypothetical protein
MRNLWNRCGDLWCEFMHSGSMWPIHGTYRCRQCLRTRPVSWGQPSGSGIRPKTLVIAKKNGLLAA